MEPSFEFPPAAVRVLDALHDLLFAVSRVQERCVEARSRFQTSKRQVRAKPDDQTLEAFLTALDAEYSGERSTLMLRFRKSVDHFWRANWELEQSLDAMPDNYLMVLEDLGGRSWKARLRLVLDRITAWYRPSQPKQLDDLCYFADYECILAKLLEEAAPDPSDDLAKLRAAVEELYALRTSIPAAEVSPACMPIETHRSINQLLDGPDDAELSPRELALLEAYLQQPGNRPTLREQSDRSNGRGESVRLKKLSKLRLILGFNRNLLEATKPTPGEPDAANAGIPEPNTISTASAETNRSMLFARLLNVYSNGVSDKKFEVAIQGLGNSSLSCNEKLELLDRCIRIPDTASAQDLANLLGVTKTAIQRTTWWRRVRKGRSAEIVSTREAQLRKRSEQDSADNLDD